MTTCRTYPYPVAHCDFCAYSGYCAQRRVDDDHLCLVANIRRDQIGRLNEAGVATLAALAAFTPNGAGAAAGLTPRALAALRAQAALQLRERATGEACYEFLRPEALDPDGSGAARGFALLPAPCEGDLFFDMEGDPLVGEGREYLFGVSFEERGELTFRSFWGHTEEEERFAFAGFVDFVCKRRRKYPDLHIYHYAHYESTALGKLACRHGIREREIDDLLRSKILIDLYQVVRQSVRISKPSYSLKEIEAFYMPKREGEVVSAVASIVAYEAWRDTGDPEILAEIERYNRIDCESTAALRDWLLQLRVEAERNLGVTFPWFTVAAVPEQDEKRDTIDTEIDALVHELEASIDVTDPTREGLARRVIVPLVNYHRREARPEWWAYFARQRKTPEELIDDTECIGDVAYDPAVEPRKIVQSWGFTLRFPPQETKLGVGDDVFDPATGARVGTVAELDVERRARRRQAQGLTGEEAVSAGARPGAAAERHDPTAGDPARRAFAARRRPAPLSRGGRSAFGQAAAPAQKARGRISAEGDPDFRELCALADDLDESCLVVQGPPGSGKTLYAAKLIVHLLRRRIDGRSARIAVAARGHKAIHNLLNEVERQSDELGIDFAGLYKHSDEQSEYAGVHGGRFIGSTKDNSDFEPARPEIRLIAGTQWLHSREKLEGWADYLFIDEAGQVALADAVAMATAARNVICFGDPAQLAQVTKALHPGTSGGSVLDHVIGDGTITPTQGYFLGVTYRMHPEITAYISERFYAGRLTAAPDCARQQIAGVSERLRFVPVEHEQCSQRSPAEARVVAEQIAALLGRTYTDRHGNGRALTVRRHPRRRSVQCAGACNRRCVRGRRYSGRADRNG